MHTMFKLFLPALATLSLTTAHAEPKTYRLGAFPIPLMVESQDVGVFVELTRELAKRADVKVEIIVAPTKRTISDFDTGQIDGFFPALDVTVPKKAEASSEIYIKKDFGFVLKPNRPPESIADLKGKTVGLTSGYPYVQEIARNQSIQIEYANTDELNVKKLVNGRYGVFIVEEKSGLKAFEKENALDKVTYAKDRPLSQQKVYYAFQPDADGKQLAKKFSDALDSMKNDGSFQRIMKKAE